MIGWSVSAADADAQTFAPVPCITCGSGAAAFPYAYDSNVDLQPDPNNTANYLSAQNVRRVVVGNVYLRKLSWNFSRFTTEAGKDWFGIGPAFGGGIAYSGTPILTGYGYDAGAASSMQSQPLALTFQSDATLDYSGVGIQSASSTVCCNANPSNITVTGMTPGDRADVLLLGTNDVVYVAVASPPAGQSIAVTMAGDELPGFRSFGMYARCNALPTAVTYSWVGLGGEVDKLMLLPGTGCVGTWYIAVNSSSGFGVARLNFGRYFSAARHTMTAGMLFNAPQATQAQIAQTLNNAAKYLYGASEGTQQIYRFDLYNNVPGTTFQGHTDCLGCGGTAPGAACDICVRNTPGTGGCCDQLAGTDGVLHEQIGISQGYFTNGPGLAHEMGHRYFSYSYPAGVRGTFVADEYGGGGASCGHSLMAFLYPNACQATNHGNANTPGQPPAGGLAVWDIYLANGYTPTKPTTTPDAYTYSDFTPWIVGTTEPGPFYVYGIGYVVVH